MKYSDSNDYMRYLRALAQDDYAQSLSALEECLSDPRATGWDAAQVADLLRRKGDLLFVQGLIGAASEAYDAAEEADPNSLLVKCMHAQFLSEKMRDIGGAISKCEEVITVATEHPFPETADDFSSEYYKALAGEIKARVLKGLVPEE